MAALYCKRSRPQTDSTKEKPRIPREAAHAQRFPRLRSLLVAYATIYCNKKVKIFHQKSQRASVMAWECIGEEVKRGGQCIYSGNAFMSRKPRNTHTLLIHMTEHKTVQVSCPNTKGGERLSSWAFVHSDRIGRERGISILDPA